MDKAAAVLQGFCLAGEDHHHRAAQVTHVERFIVLIEY